MNTRNEDENEKTAEPREARTPKVVEPYEKDPESTRDAQDSREPVEGGYGWGV